MPTAWCDGSGESLGQPRLDISLGSGLALANKGDSSLDVRMGDGAVDPERRQCIESRGLRKVSGKDARTLSADACTDPGNKQRRGGSLNGIFACTDGRTEDVCRTEGCSLPQVSIG